MTTQPTTTQLRWKTESICAPSHRRSYSASTAAGRFRIVPSDFLPLDDLMAGRSVPRAGFEIHWIGKTRQDGPTQVYRQEHRIDPRSESFLQMAI